MLRIFKKLLFFLSLFNFSTLIYSSLSFKPVVQDHSSSYLTKFDLKKLDGDYETKAADSSFGRLDDYLISGNKFGFFEEIARPQVDRINIKSMREKYIQITAYKDDRVIKTKILKVNFSNGYFTVRQMHFNLIYPFFILINSYAGMKCSMSLNKENDLILDSYDTRVLLLTVLPTLSGSSERDAKVFRRENGFR